MPHITKALFLVAIVALITAAIAGCVDPQDPTVNSSRPNLSTSTLTDTSPIDKLNPLTHNFSDLGISLVFPEMWRGRFGVTRSDQWIEVTVDDVSAFSLAFVENRPGAQERDAQLVEAGYQYLSDNYARFFYYKVHSVLPKELCQVNSYDSDAEIRTEETIKQCIIFDSNDACCNIKKDNDFRSYLTLDSNIYENHRLGIGFSVPESWLDTCHIEATDRYVYIGFYDEEHDMHLLLCSFGSFPAGESILYPGGTSNMVAYGEYYYGALNLWQNTPTNLSPTIRYRYEQLSDNVKNNFKTEEVQSVVDSFIILPLDVNSDE